MLPTFIVIGAMKGGTSSLYRYLDAHPEICMSSTKETDFFIAEKNFSRGRGWYESLFAAPAAAKPAATQFGEASPNYSKFPRFAGVPERMHALVPEAKLIYVVRDPVARMISHYAHNISAKYETLPIDEALRPPAATRYLVPSRYLTQLDSFRQYYPLDRMLVVSSDDLLSQRREAMRRIFSFLGVDPSFDSPTFNTQYHDTAGKFRRAFKPSWPTRVLTRLGLARPAAPPPAPPRELGDETRRILIDLLRPEIDGFRRLTGQQFEQWCV
jgi:hypothetical protein